MYVIFGFSTLYNERDADSMVLSPLGTVWRFRGRLKSPYSHAVCSTKVYCWRFISSPLHLFISARYCFESLLNICQEYNSMHMMTEDLLG